jgi:hypothetical protein
LVIQEDIVRRIKERKLRLLNNVRDIFMDVLVKEQSFNEGDISLSQVLYSADMITSSS